MCVPKEEGGSGLMTSKDWNKAAIIKHIGNVAQPKNRPIWVNWIEKKFALRRRIFGKLKRPRNILGFGRSL